MKPILPYSVNGQQFVLHHHRVVYWEQEKTIILSDLHIGKTGHFRKSGIAVPMAVTREDLQRLTETLQFFKPRRMIVVGDLFHSIENREHDWFAAWRSDFLHLECILVKGNHDIIPDEWYQKNRILVEPEVYKLSGFQFSHQLENMPAVTEAGYTFSGHIHPAISIRGLAKQALRFPCFYFTDQFAVLPAFGKFTGTHLIEPAANEKTFAIVKNGLMPV